MILIRLKSFSAHLHKLRRGAFVSNNEDVRLNMYFLNVYLNHLTCIVISCPFICRVSVKNVAVSVLSRLFLEVRTCVRSPRYFVWTYVKVGHVSFDAWRSKGIRYEFFLRRLLRADCMVTWVSYQHAGTTKKIFREPCVPVSVGVIFKGGQGILRFSNMFLAHWDTFYFCYSILDRIEFWEYQHLWMDCVKNCVLPLFSILQELTWRHVMPRHHMSGTCAFSVYCDAFTFQATNSIEPSCS
jgi:hypothetical protein